MSNESIFSVIVTQGPQVVALYTYGGQDRFTAEDTYIREITVRDVEIEDSQHRQNLIECMECDIPHGRVHLVHTYLNGLMTNTVEL